MGEPEPTFDPDAWVFPPEWWPLPAQQWYELLPLTRRWLSVPGLGKRIWELQVADSEAE